MGQQSPTPLGIERTKNGSLLRVHIQPKASRSEVVGRHGERIKIRIMAPPVDGEANAELLSFLKKKLKVPASDLQLLRGQSSKMKDIECLHLTPQQVEALLGLTATNDEPTTT